MNSRYTLVSCQHHITDSVVDVGKGIAGSFGEGSTRRFVKPFACQTK